MANSFDLNTFLQNYKNYNANSFTAAENGKKAQEQREIEEAEKAVKGQSFLSLTLSEKLLDLGVGPRVAELVKGTAVNAVKEIVNPFGEFLKKYDYIFDEEKYNQELQGLAKTMFFSNQALEEAVDNKLGRKLVIDS